MSEFRRFLPIAKIDKAEQMVWGYASTPALDLDDEKVSLKAIKAALPDYLEWSNIREMHQPSAVGVAKEATVDEKGLWLGAKITDPVAWQKCVDRVYKGFSIGGTIVKKVGKTIEELMLVEISIVDRPANPECRIEVVKAAKAVDGGEASLLPVGLAAPLLAKMLAAEGPDLSDSHASFVGTVVAKVLQTLGFGKSGDGFSAPATIVHTHTEHGELPNVATDLPDPGAKSNIDPFESHLEPLGKDAEDSAKKPYGDVEYADPGHQADGKHRYPVDTEEHIRSAWSYINKPGNASKYSAEQLSSVRGKIESAWKDKIDAKGPPSAEKSAEPASIFDDFLSLAKGMRDVHELVGAFDRLRDVQRTRISEGALEGGDQTDFAASRRAGEIARDVAALISEIVAHEASESESLTDVDDLRAGGPYPSYDYQTPLSELIEMSASASDLAKRVSAARAMHFGKAAHHLGKAAECQKGAMSCCKSLVGMHKDMAMAAKAAKDAGGDAAAITKAISKAAEGMDHEAAMGHLHKMSGHLSAMEDHHDLAMHHLGKAAGTEQMGTESWDGTSMPHAPVDTNGLEIPAAAPAPGKAAMSKEHHEELLAAAVKAAKLEGELEVLKRMPAGANRARTFDVGKAAGLPEGQEGTDKLQALLKGVNTGATDQDEVSRNAGRMIGNMLSNPNMFGRNPATDPNFRGAAG